MLGALVGLVVGQFRSRASLVAENELLRQQLGAAKSRLLRKRMMFTGSAVAAHIANHGDHLGPCTAGEEPDGGNSGTEPDAGQTRMAAREEIRTPERVNRRAPLVASRCRRAAPASPASTAPVRACDEASRIRWSTSIPNLSALGSNLG